MNSFNWRGFVAWWLIPGLVCAWLICGPGPAFASTIARAVFYQLIGIGGSSQTARGRLNLIQGSGVTLTPADNAGTNSTDVTIAASAVSLFYQLIGIGGSSQTARGRLNLIQGANITLTPADNGGTDSTDVTIAASAGSTGALGTPYASLDSTNYFGPVSAMTRPGTLSWAWVNQGTATITDLNSALTLDVPISAGVNLRIREMTPPATPYTLVAVCSVNQPDASFIRQGIGFRESGTAKITTVSTLAGAAMTADNWTNATSFAGSLGSIPVTGTSRGLWWFRITNNGATLTYSVSSNGFSYTQIASVAINAFFTTAPDRVVFFSDPNNAIYGAGITVYGWDFT